jgi:hypothetical protein
MCLGYIKEFGRRGVQSHLFACRHQWISGFEGFGTKYKVILFIKTHQPN